MKKRFLFGAIIAITALTVILGAVLLKNKQYAAVSLAVAVLSCAAFFTSFERRQHAETKLILIAVMTALSVAGRILFAALPGFKPVTAMVVITAMYFGAEAGFVTGAMTAALSNFYFGQGPWTPFQMLAWGIIGLAAGLMSGVLKRSRAALVIYGVLAGVAFSLLMDVWTALWWDGVFSPVRYAALVVSALPVTAEYAVSNAIFLIVLAKPLGNKIERIRDKYGVN